MATIRASCPDCGDVELTGQDMMVLVCLDDNKGAYRFRCTECGMVTFKWAEQRIVDLLLSSGIRGEVWRLPDELHEITRKRAEGTPPISHDDLLELHELLQTANWFDQLAAITTE